MYKKVLWLFVDLQSEKKKSFVFQLDPGAFVGRCTGGGVLCNRLAGRRRRTMRKEKEEEEEGGGGGRRERREEEKRGGYLSPRQWPHPAWGVRRHVRGSWCRLCIWLGGGGG